MCWEKRFDFRILWSFHFLHIWIRNSECEKPSNSWGTIQQDIQEGEDVQKEDRAGEQEEKSEPKEGQEDEDANEKGEEEEAQQE